jgi:hypothetical protein
MYSGGDNDFGKTGFNIVNSTGQVKNMEDLLDIGDVKPEDITTNTVINITIGLNSKNTGDLGITAESVLHEFSIHMLPYLKLIDKLRSGDKVGQDFINEWKSASANEGPNNYNNGHKQHLQFANGKNIEYNKIHNEMKSQMTNPTDQNSFVDESIRSAINYLPIKLNNHL